MDKDIVQRELSEITHVIREPGGVIPERYIISWRANKGDALAVVAPSTNKEIQDIINYARNNSLHIVTQGQRTGLVDGSVPSLEDGKHSIIISMERYRNRLIYNEIDRRVIVDSGYSLNEVNEFLKPYGVHIPINVSSNPMIGGAVATNIGGSRVIRFGDARKLVLGIEVLLADEDLSIYSTLERPRKDNSSINFNGVFCGSFGAFGIITSVAFEVSPLFYSTYTAWMSISSDIDMTELLHRIESVSKETLLACEFVSSQACEVIGSSEEMNHIVPFALSGNDVLFVEWGTTQKSFLLNEYVEVILQELLEQGFVDDIEVVPPDTTWQIRHKFSEILRKRGKLIANDISVPRDKVQQLRTNVAIAIASYDQCLVVRDFGHLGDGGLHINVVIDDEEKLDSWSYNKTQEVRTIIAQQAFELGGSFSAEHGLGSANTLLYDKFIDRTSKELALQFKKICDPNYLLGHEGIEFATKGKEC